MTDKDRLIEILKVPIYPKIGVDPAEVVADYLLANGVIVLPDVKVGSVVYQTSENCRISKETITDITIILDRYEPPYIKCDTECKVGEYVYSSYFNCDLLGKTVFLTKEEAEEKLQELNAKALNIKNN